MKIFWDVDTQNDFMNEGGALYVSGAEEIKPNLAMLTNYAEHNGIPILGSVDKHFGTSRYQEREGELTKWGGPFPEHCMAGSQGQEKIPETLISDPTSGWKGQELIDLARYIPNPLTEEKLTQQQIEMNVEMIQHTYHQIPVLANKCTPHAMPVSRHWGGFYFEKQSYDVSTNPLTKKVLNMLGPEEAVVYGVATDYCVKAAVLHLQDLGIQCNVVEDAIRGITPESSQKALEEMVQAGARLVQTEEVLGGVI